MTTMYVGFWLSSDKYNFDFSDLILCEEIKKNKIGDINKRRGEVINRCNWSCYTTKKECVFTSDALKDLYEILKTNFGDIKKRISELNLTVNIYVAVDTMEKDDVYAIDFSKEMIKMCAELNAEVCVDGIYY